MFNYIKRKLEKRKIKSTFKEYGHELKIYQLPDEGEVNFALWQNPLEAPKSVTQSMVDFFKKFIPKGSLAIDIGTHIGDTTVPMALAAGKEGMVIGLDPNPLVFKIFEINAGLNKDKTNILPLNYAISETEGEFYFNSSEATFNNGGISKERTKMNGGYEYKEKIKGINLEKYLKANHQDKLSSLSFIKIDTEGHDNVILQSISSLLDSARPIVVFECFTKLGKQERYDLYSFMADKRYSVYYFEDFKEDAKIIKISKEEMTRWKHFDVLAIPEEKVSGVNL